MPSGLHFDAKPQRMPLTAIMGLGALPESVNATHP